MTTIRNIKNCSRCGGDHDAVETQKMDRPFAPPEAGGIAWTHFAPCPTNGQPIMVVLGKASEETAAIDDIPSGRDRFEEAVEWCYWRFDSLRAGTAPDRKEAGLGPQEERDAYKAVLRSFYAAWGPGSNR